MSCCTLQELSEKIPFLPEITDNYEDDTDLLDEDKSGPENDKCFINLDKRTGDFPPFLLKNSNEMAYPEGSRKLGFGMKSHL